MIGNHPSLDPGGPALDIIDWQSALSKTLNEFIDKDYQLGIADCCQFAARYWFLMTGINHANEFSYQNRNEAIELLRKNIDLFGLVQNCLGEPNNFEPQPGSVVVMKQKESIMVGVYNGFYVIGFIKDIGCSRWGLHKLLGSWHASSCSRRNT